jgi:hypothetical protein
MPGGYYESPKKKAVIGPFRVETEIRRGLEALMQLWRLEALAKGDDPKSIDLTHVASRLIAVGLDGAFEEILQESNLERMPVSEVEWGRFEAALQKRLKKK